VLQHLLPVLEVARPLVHVAEGLLLLETGQQLLVLGSNSKQLFLPLRRVQRPRLGTGHDVRVLVLLVVHYARHLLQENAIGPLDFREPR